MTIFRIIAQLIIGLVFGVGSALALSPLLAVFMGREEPSPVAGLVVIAAVALLAAAAPTIRRAIGRGFLCIGAAVFILPLSTLVLSGVVTNETITTAAEADKGMAAAGGLVAGGLMTGIAGFVGFFLGSVLLLFGLVLSLGGQREVVVRRR